MIVSELVKNMIKEHYEYIANYEREATEKERKIATIKHQTRLLQANLEIIKRYFKNQMEERNQLFKSANEMLDVAIKRGDYEIAQIAMIILEIMNKKSPFSSEL